MEKAKIKSVAPNIQDNAKGVVAAIPALAAVSFGFNSIASSISGSDTLSLGFGLVAGAISGAWVFQKHRYGEAYLRQRDQQNQNIEPTHTSLQNDP